MFGGQGKIMQGEVCMQLFVERASQLLCPRACICRQTRRQEHRSVCIINVANTIALCFNIEERSSCQFHSDITLLVLRLEC
jgi:hypothetical protein